MCNKTGKYGLAKRRAVDQNNNEVPKDRDVQRRRQKRKFGKSESAAEVKRLKLETRSTWRLPSPTEAYLSPVKLVGFGQLVQRLGVVGLPRFENAVVTAVHKLRVYLMLGSDDVAQASSLSVAVPRGIMNMANKDCLHLGGYLRSLRRENRIGGAVGCDGRVVVRKLMNPAATQFCYSSQRPMVTRLGRPFLAVKSDTVRLFPRMRESQGHLNAWRRVRMAKLATYGMGGGGDGAKNAFSCWTKFKYLMNPMATEKPASRARPVVFMVRF